VSRSIGFALGLFATPILMVGFSEAVIAWYGGLDPSIEHSVALRTTQDLTEALDRYRSRFRRLPDVHEGLAALSPIYLEHLPLDPWGNPFIYAPSDGTLCADVLSYGADGQPGGSGLASDVSGRFGRLGDRPPSYLDALSRLILGLIPVIGLLASGRSPWGIGFLAGTGVFWGGLLLATLGIALRGSLAAVVPLAVGLSCMTGSVASLRGARGATFVTCAAILAASLLLEQLITA
jgi:general secretion pathway protein G